MSTKPRKILRMASGHPSAHVGQVDPYAAVRRLREPATLMPTTSGLVDANGMALDSAAGCCDVLDFMRGAGIPGQTGFIGYGMCAQLAQDAFIRLGVETLADEMLREWGRIQGVDPDAADKINAELERLRVRKMLRNAAADAGYFGVGYVFIDTGTRDPEELLSPLWADPAKLRSGGRIQRLQPVDPSLVSPGEYNANDPLSRWFYTPRWFYLLGRRVHTSRMLKVVQHVPPLLLRPVYNFGGIPAAQQALDYLLHFTTTREAAARLLRKFSLTVFKTAAQGLIYNAEGAEADIIRRLTYFARNRDNDGVELIDKDDEDIVQINTPLSGVDVIVRQALEMLSAVFHMPVTKFLGISPGGMNATGESDSRNWYDYAGSQQETMLGPAMRTMLELLQAQELGGVDRALQWQWLPMWTPSAREQAETVKIGVDAAVALVGTGIASPDEARTVLAAGEDSPWSGLDDDADGYLPPEIPDSPDVMETVGQDSAEGRFARLWQRMTARFRGGRDA